jgi:hypothetical protein
MNQLRGSLGPQGSGRAVSGGKWAGQQTRGEQKYGERAD